MKLLVVGGGGREHAIIRSLKKNPEVETIYALPGNGGIAADAECVAIGAKDIPAIVAFAKENGYVKTLTGRRRYIPELSSSKKTMVSFGERVAMNSPIQGSAADIMKLAMIEIRRRFQKEGIRSQMILQVHDEVIVDMLREESDKVISIVREAMEGVVPLRVPLISDTGTGQNWLEAH